MDERVDRRLGQEASPDLEAARGGLRRVLSSFANFGLAYSGIGVSAGLFTLFGFSLSSSGPAMFWGWPIIALGALVICLMWAEMSSHYPYAGVMYQWPMLLAGRRVGWFIGWLYLFANIALVTATFSTIWVGFVPLLGLTYTTGTGIAFALVSLVGFVGLNILGIGLVGRITERAVILELGIVGLVLVLLLIFGHHSSPAIFLQSAGTGSTFHAWLPGFLGGGIFVAVWVFYFFETAGTLGEETIDAPRSAPRSVLGTWGTTFIIGLLTLFVFILAAPNITGAMKSSTPIPDIIGASLPSFFTKLYLAVITLVLLLGANVALTSAARHVYGMARDGTLPFSGFLSRLRTETGTPWAALITVAVIGALPFIASQSFAVIITGATAFFYVVYLLVMVTTLWARLRGWPKAAAPFSLGRWGIPLNIVAVLFTAALTVDLMWFRNSTNPTFHGLRVALWMFGVPAVAGILYYALVQRRRVDATQTFAQPESAGTRQP